MRTKILAGFASGLLLSLAVMAANIVVMLIANLCVARCRYRSHRCAEDQSNTGSRVTEQAGQRS